MSPVLDEEALAAAAELPIRYYPTDSERIACAIYNVGASIVQGIAELRESIENDPAHGQIATALEAIATHLREIDTTLGTK